MKKPIRIVLIIVVLVVAVVALVFFSSRDGAREALAARKTDLRAKGERLTWGELGFPRKAVTDQSVDRLVAGVFHLGQAKYPPGQLKWMDLTGPGRAQSCWAPALPGPAGSWGAKTNTPTWAEFSAQMETTADALSEMREALKDPPRYFVWDVAGYPEISMPPFVQFRNAAHWLAADVIGALHAGQFERALADLHALTQLSQLHRDDFMLVSQMIRVAISGLGLAVTWEALQAPGWSEEQLAALQRDWEAVDLLDAAETGLLGARASGEWGFETARSPDENQSTPFLSLASGRAGNPFEDWIVGPYWRAHMDVDELFFLDHFQKSLAGVRKLRSGAAWPAVNRELEANTRELEQLLSHPIKKYHYLYSGIAIPDIGRVSRTVVRNETLRRLTVVVIALERHRLRNGKFPSELGTLVPDFLASVSIDPMSAKPLRYRLSADGSFTLYSVGEDGRDDGGDARHPIVTNRFDLWEGRDAVWPAAVK
jgi:hypothetical protein